MTKRQFIMDTGKERIPVEGHEHKNVAIKYLMKRRRSLLMTKDSQKVEKLFQELPTKISIIGKMVTKVFNINWERQGKDEWAGARFVFALEEKV